MIQHRNFSDGSFVLHKITINDHEYSAWFTDRGKLKNAEKILPDGSTRSVPNKHTQIRYFLELVASRYANR